MNTIAYNAFKTHWFANPQWWFHPSKDEDCLLGQTFETWVDETDKHKEMDQDIVTLVLLYDQLPRHYYRGEYANHILQYYLEKALTMVLSIQMEAMDRFNDMELCFVLLPLRHSNIPSYIMKALDIVWSRSTLHRHNKVLKRFLTATYQRMPLSSPLFRNMFIHGPSMPSVDSCASFNRELFMNILDPLCLDTYFDLEVSLDIIEHAKRRLSEFNPPLLLSLSGGVDSMVCASILQTLNIPFTAVHIHYGNGSLQELEFIRAWCASMHIPLVDRSMVEIKRKPCMTIELRNIYETYTKNARFDTYICAYERMTQTSTTTEDSTIRVILGHNQDDCFENILTNIAHCNQYDNLKGMTHASIQKHHNHTIQLLRPLLNIPKKDIYAFALSNNVPFLKDSTPKWSQRGKIRDHVRPTMESWESSIVQSFLKLAEILEHQSNTMERMVHGIFLTMTRNTLNAHQMQWVHATHDLTSFSTEIWKMLFQKICPFQCPSKRSIASFIERLERNIHSQKSQHYTIHSQLHISHSFKDQCMTFSIYPYNPS